MGDLNLNRTGEILPNTTTELGTGVGLMNAAQISNADGTTDFQITVNAENAQDANSLFNGVVNYITTIFSGEAVATPEEANAADAWTVAASACGILFGFVALIKGSIECRQNWKKSKTNPNDHCFMSRLRCLWCPAD